jgi:hypothetical protein
VAIGDIWSVTLLARKNDQEVRNVFYYEQTNTENTLELDAQKLGFGFEAKFLDVAGEGLRSVAISNSVSYYGYEIRNLYDESVFLDLFFATPFTGGGTTESLPPFVAYGFRSDRTRSDVRRGFKRFTGVLEDQIQATGYSLATITELQTEIGDKLGEQLQAVGTDPIYLPGVVGRIKYEVEPGKFAYRLPENPAETKFMYTTNWVLQSQPTTQNSRKIGRGI